MELINIAGLVVCAVIITSVVGRYSPWAGILIPVAVSAVSLLYLMPQIKYIVDRFGQVFIYADSKYVMLLLKVVGISFLAQITAQICTDAGQKAMGDKIETAARIIIAVYTLPLISDMIALITSFIGE